METFNYRGLTINAFVLNEDNGARIEYNNNGVNHYVYAKLLRIDAANRFIDAIYFKDIKDENGDLILDTPERGVFDANKPDQWDAFANSTAPDGLLVAIYNHLVNGITNAIFGESDEFVASGIRIFDTNGAFYQPVTFDMVVNNSTTESDADGSIDITTIDGSAPFQYALFDNNNTELVAYQEVASFAGLSSGSYVVKVKDANNIISSSKVTDLSNIV